MNLWWYSFKRQWHLSVICQRRIIGFWGMRQMLSLFLMLLSEFLFIIKIKHSAAISNITIYIYIYIRQWTLVNKNVALTEFQQFIINIAKNSVLCSRKKLTISSLGCWYCYKNGLQDCSITNNTYYSNIFATFPSLAASSSTRVSAAVFSASTIEMYLDGAKP